MGSTILWIIAIGALVILLFSTVLFLAGRYKRCPSDKILVIYGKVDEGRSSRCMHGGGALILPLIQDLKLIIISKNLDTKSSPPKNRKGSCWKPQARLFFRSGSMMEPCWKQSLLKAVSSVSLFCIFWDSP